MFPLSPRRSLANNAKPLVLSIGTTTLGAITGVALVLTGTAKGGLETASIQQTTQQLQLGHLLVTNTSVLTVLALGGLLIGIPTLIVLFQNGLVVGLLAGTAAGTGELGTFFALTLPHAVFELPAFWIAGCVGLKVPVDLGAYLLKGRDAPLRRRDIVQMAILLIVAFSLVVIAAVIESQITAQIARLRAQGVILSI